MLFGSRFTLILTLNYVCRHHKSVHAPGVLMVGSSPQQTEPSPCCAREPDDLFSSVQRGRISKKRGLSRHYPYKAQSFDCIASLFFAGGDASSHILSKSTSGRSVSLRQLSSSLSSTSVEQVQGTMRRVASNATIQECSLEDSWTSLELELCSALQTQANIEQAHPPAEFCAGMQQRATCCDASSSIAGAIAR